MRGTAIALRGAAAPWTYQHLRERSSAVASCLSQHGVTIGERVLLVAPSVPEFAAAYYGIHAIGAIAVTANAMSTAAELEYFGRDAAASLVLAWHEIEPAPTRAAAALGVPYRSLFDELADLPVAAPAPLHESAESDTAVILYTSGTTGQPKGAELTHGNILACGEIIGQVLELTDRDRLGMALPLFHVFGQVAMMSMALHHGASVSLLQRFEPGAMLDLLIDHRLTLVAGVPTMWNALLHASENRSPEAFSALRAAVSGGAALPMSVLTAFEERFGCTILEGYGLSETAGAATFTGLHRGRKPGSVGIALPRLEVQVVDDAGDPVANGERGEVWIRGPVVMKSYWDRPEATSETLHDGWLRTGDIGTLDETGDLRIVDRKKDLIIRGGYNVYPREVEEILYQHPDVVEVAVIGIPDEHYGEEIAAVLTLRVEAEFDPVALREWATRHLSAYKIPRLYLRVDSLPKGPSGKILKRAIDRAVVVADAQRVSSRTALTANPQKP